MAAVFPPAAASHRVFTTQANICGTPLLLPLQHILVSPQRAQAYTECAFLNCTQTKCNRAFLTFSIQVNPLVHPRQTEPTLRHVAASLQAEGLCC